MRSRPGSLKPTGRWRCVPTARSHTRDRRPASPPETPGRSTEAGVELVGVGSVSAFRAILAKDLRVELRTLQSVPAMALFALTTFVLFRYGLDRERLEGSLAAGV